MKAKLMVLAVAGALAAPVAALAQTGSVQIYGRAHVGIDNYSATGSTAGSAGDFKSRSRVYDALSRIGFRGSEDLGGGLKAVFNIESGINLDNGGTTGQSGQSNTSAGTLGSRVSYVGLDGHWGRLTFGRQNVWWVNGKQDQIFANLLNNSNGISTGTFGRGMGVGVSRVNNVVQYTSPVMNGINAVVSYSPGSQEAQGAGQNADGKLVGFTLQGERGAFAGGWDYVKNEANRPASGSQRSTTGNKLRAGWTYQPGGMVSLIWVKSKQEDGGTGIGGTSALPGQGGLVDPTSSNLSQNAWTLTWEHLIGNVQLLAQGGRVQNVSGCRLAGACDNTGSTNYLAAVRYLFSKRTAVYASYIKIQNESNANMDIFAGGLSSAGAGGLGADSVGADPRIVALGVVHNF